jgi:hypothetical protein
LCGLAFAWGGIAPVRAASSVTLAWNANSETNLAGYRLYYGAASHAYSDNVSVAAPTTIVTVSNLLEGQTYYFAVTAFCTDGLESDYSAEISYLVPNTGSPNLPPTLTALGNLSIAEDAGPQTVLLAGITSGSVAEIQPLTVTATSSNPGLIPNPSVSYTSPSLTGSLSFTPVANLNGSATITVTVNDGQGANNLFSRTFTVTVTAVNDPPTLATLGNLTINEDAGAQAVSLAGIGTGAANESQALVVTATSSAPSVVPNPTVSYTSPNPSGTLTLTPAANASGSAVITVTVNDGQSANNITTRTFNVTVNPVNDAPTLNALGNLSLPISAGAQTVSLSGIGTGAANESQALAVTATSSNPSLIPNPTVSYVSPNTTGSLSFTPVGGGSGTATITVTVNDGQAANNTIVRTFTVSVAVNQTPTLATISNRTINEDAGGQTVNLTGIGTGSASEIQTLTVTATSSNPGLIPQPTVNYTSPSATGSLGFTPVANANGSATITVTVNDGQSANNTVSQTFTVTVTSVNDAPTLAALSNVSISEDASSQTVSLAGIGSGAANESQTLTVTATSSTPGLIPNPTVSYTSPATTGSLVFTPVANASGTATITVTVNDGQSANNTVSQNFTVTVTAVNDAPTLAALGNLTINEDAASQTVSLSGIGSGAANESQALTVTATSSNPSVVPNPSVNYSSANPTGSLSLSPVANASGVATVTVTVNDGQSVNNTVTRTFTVTVNAVNDAPTLDPIANLSLPANATMQVVSLAGIGTGAPNESDSLVVTAVSSNPSLIPNPAVDYASPGPTGALTFTPAAGGSGMATITVTVNDGQSINNATVRTFNVSVAANQPPTLATIANRTINEDAGGQSVSLTGIGTGAGNENQTLTVTATSSNPALVPNPTVTYASPSATGSLNFSPVANANGVANITVTVNDGQAQNNTVSQTFAVTVTSVNDAPTLAPLSNVTINEDAGSQAVSLAGIGSGAANESQTLVVTATSSNPSVIPNPSVSYVSPGASGSLSFTPAANATGSAIITVTVNDGQSANNTVSQSFTVTITPLNDPPTLAVLNNVTISEDAGAQSVTLTGIGAGAANESQVLSVTASSSNPSVVPNPSVSYASPNTTGLLSFTPVASASGTATVTVTVNDGQPANNTVTRTFTVTVNPVNDAPTLDPIANLSLPGNAGLQVVTLTGVSSGAANESQPLSVTATSSNPSLVPNPTVSYLSPNTSGTLSFTPAASGGGSATITVTVNDGQALNNTVTRTFTVSVAMVNQPPTLTSIPDQTVNEDAAAQTLYLSGIGSGGANENQTLTVTVTSGNPALIPQPTLVYTSPNTTAALSYTPVPNAYGSALLTVTVDDGQAANNQLSRSFTVTVSPVNDAPTLDPLANLALNEDAGPQLVSLTGLGTGAANESQTLVVTTASSNPSIVPPPTVNYTSPNTTGTLTVAPAADATGTATISVTVNDGQAQNNTVVRTFTVTIGATNDAPTMASVPNLTINEDAGVQTVNLTGISGGPGESQTVTLTATSSNPSLIPNPAIVYANPNTTGSLNFTPAANGNGSATITVTLDDGQPQNNLTTRSFVVTVTPVNDLPTLNPLANVPLALNAPAQTVSLSGIGPGAANESQSLTVTAASSNPGLVPNPTVSYTSANSTGSLSFTPVSGVSGSATITVTVNDGQAQNNSFSRQFTVSVGSGNQPPTLNPLVDLVLNEDAPQQLVNFGGISAGPGESQTLTVTATSSDPSLIPPPVVRYSSPTSGGYITFTPVPNAHGTAWITITVNDGQSVNNTVSRIFQVTINSINDVPTLSPISNVELIEDSGSYSVPLAGISTGAANENQTLVILATSSNPSVIPHPEVLYASPATNGTLRLNPVRDAVGSATITVTVNDGDTTLNLVTRTFYVAIRGVNDMPLFSPIADQNIRAGETTGPLPFTVTDADTAMANVRVSVTSSDVVLLPASGLVLGGSGTNRTIAVTPALGRTGRASVILAATDGYTTNTTTFLVIVGDPDQPPAIAAIADQVVDASTTLAGVAVQVSDDITPAAALTVSASSFNQSILPDSGLVVSGSGTSRQLSITPAKNKSGLVTIAVVVSDGVRQTQVAFQLTVRTVRSRLTVNKKGQGAVEPDLNGQNLTVGQSYTLTATPAVGEVFDCWGGDVSGTSTILTFVMSSNMVVDVNFQADPYYAAAGNYNGLIVESDEVRHDRSGNFTLTSTTRGSYTGKLQIGRGKYTVKGLLGRDGRATNVVLRPGLSSLTVEMGIALNPTTGRITGRVTDGSWVASLAGDRRSYSSKTNPAPYAGTYTLVLPADPNAPEGPTGAGYGTIRIDGNGLASFVGMLADGTKASQKVPISTQGQWPFYLSLYKAGGSALGWFSLSPADGEITGLTSWIKPALVSRYYAAGLTNETMVTGSAYVPPTLAEVQAGVAHAANLVFSGANLSDFVSGEIQLLPNGKMVPSANGSIKFGVSSASGLFKGTVLDPVTQKPRAFTGVVLQKWNIGAGLILGLDQVGLVELAQP